MTLPFLFCLFLFWRGRYWLWSSVDSRTVTYVETFNAESQSGMPTCWPWETRELNVATVGVSFTLCFLSCLFTVAWCNERQKYEMNFYAYFYDDFLYTLPVLYRVSSSPARSTGGGRWVELVWLGFSSAFWREKEKDSGGALCTVALLLTFFFLSRRGVDKTKLHIKKKISHFSIYFYEWAFAVQNVTLYITKKTYYELWNSINI